MALSNVASTPLLTNVASFFARIAGVAKMVPVKYWRMAAMAVVLFWICSTLVSLFWVLMPTPEMPTPKAVPSVVKPKVDRSSRRKVDLSALQALNVLGSYDPNAEVEAVEAPQPSEEATYTRTKLNLELQGVIAGSESEDSWAIIGKADAQKLYKVGDKVAGVNGVKVADIFPIKVILNNNGTLEELWLYGEDGKNVVSARSYRPPPQPESNEEEEEGVKAEVSREDVMSVKSIGDVVRFMVATEDGKMIGYKVRPGRKRKLFDQVGLKTDDIVISVNGIEVNEPQKVREVYQALKNATEADLEVMRDGNSHSIHISMSPEG